ncbi:hypothetical protein Nepgr_032298 [Nepenthes gracilis]|uniref:Uncharacterized protein n=1 Tax=Nepenthes gracilis TaxID=150966 RepID=A0AAD3TIB6_NEPGR|nr:hypothetical protein Nepgr_032298 [Nepenthes gracilis]
MKRLRDSVTHISITDDPHLVKYQRRQPRILEAINQQTPTNITGSSITTPDQKVKSKWYNNTASIPAGPSAGCNWQFHHSLVAHHLMTAGMLMTNAAATQA